jgi:hypothetical protein
MCVAAFLAEVSAAGPLPQHTTLIGLLALGLFAVAVAAEKAVSIWHKLKKPVPDHETYATKNELAAVEARVKDEIDGVERQLHDGFGQIDHRMTQMERTLGNLVNDMARSLGRLEGQLSARLPVVPAPAADTKAS